MHCCQCVPVGRSKAFRLYFCFSTGSDWCCPMNTFSITWSRSSFTDLRSGDLTLSKTGVSMNSFLIPMAIGFLAVFVVVLIAMSYLKAPPDRALVVTGLHRRTYIGRAGLRIPFLERVDHLPLELVSIAVKTQEAIPTIDFINVFVEAAVNVRVGTNVVIDPKTQKDVSLLDVASLHFLNRKTNEIARVAQEVLEGNIREIVGKMSLKDMVQDRQAFASLVRENAEPDLEAMGLVIVSFNVQNFRDNDNIIANLGINNVATISKNASIAKANAESEVLQAKADADRRANDARVAADLEIAQKTTDLAIKKSELLAQSEVKRAEAEAAFLIGQQNQRKTTEVATASANLAKLEKETEVQAQQINLTKNTLDAEVRARADADLYEAQKRAEAELFTANKTAEANRFAMEQEAAGILAKGTSEAKAIELKGLAEATALLKKADAMKEMKEAAVIEMIINQLPEIVKNAAAPLANVKDIYMYGDSQNAKLVGDVMNSTSQVFEGLSKSLGLDAKALIAGFLGGKVASPNTSGVVVDPAGATTKSK